MIYVSHKLSEVFGVADRITVLRDGRHILTAPRSELTERQVVTAMVGRELITQAARRGGRARWCCRCATCHRGRRCRDVSFDLAAGEVVGLAGLMGSGGLELVEALFGLRPVTGGEVLLEGKPLVTRNPREAIQRRAGLRAG